MADTSTTVQKVAAEALGTFVLVFIGCGTAIFSGGDYVAIGLSFGLTVLAGVYAFGRISGGHFNPAVSVGAALGGRMAWRQVPVYVGSQLGGAIVAGLALFVLVQGIDGYDVGDSGLAQNSFGDDGTGYAWWAALLVEVILTAIFVYVILAVTDVRNEHPGLAPAAIGLTLTMIHFTSIHLTGTSVNPARSIGVGLFAGGDAIVQLWLFIIAPLIGAAVAGLSYPIVFGHGTDPVAGSGLTFARPSPAAVPGYGAPDQYQQEWNQQTAQEQAAWEQEPIIQDGWQWDHAAQEWKPLEQWQPPAPPVQAAPAQPTPATPAVPPAATDPAVAPAEQPQQGWSQPEPGTETTQLRPPE
jgi:aquaporin Z